jgi:hypothetical protein
MTTEEIENFEAALERLQEATRLLEANLSSSNLDPLSTPSKDENAS